LFSPAAMGRECVTIYNTAVADEVSSSSVQWLVNEAARWESIVGLSRQLLARAPVSLFRQLVAEENLFKEVVILGLLQSNQTLDNGEIKIIGPNPELLSHAVSPSQ
jgi:hypothetical protein